jgi:type VI secretion system protein ImpM
MRLAGGACNGDKANGDRPAHGRLQRQCLAGLFVPANLVSGFYGKLPARGDFLRAGLPRSFTDPWDAWWQAAIACSRSALGDEWLTCWMEAPIWRFSLPDGICGPHGALGLWMPSVDRAGRYFPLTFALLQPGASPDALASAGASWLDEAEKIGLDALENESVPESITERLEALPTPAAASGAGEALWWTAGSPYVAPAALRFSGLPDPVQFATMIRNPPTPDGTQTQGGFLEAT